MKYRDYASHADEFVREISTELDLGGAPEPAHRALKSALVALRKALPVEASSALLGHLPMLIKAVYVDGWDLKGAAWGDESAAARLLERTGRAGDESRRRLRALVRVIRRRASDDELVGLVSALPRPLAIFWTASG
ncbi:MAG: DUF2267 domain-containing protein [Myxococcales bacterium]|nr:DUF2267 domain-containing protein [Myxococcales bacterium]MCB9704016.1 DUF2267 domain-containing protein [Myxococcales bacterium]